nr:hypothetical protein [Synechococcus elongatus]
MANAQTFEQQRIHAEAQLAAAAAQLAELSEVAIGTLETAMTPLPVSRLTVADLKQRYGSYQGCRRAAAQLGIRFPKTPSWEQLAIALSHVGALKAFWQQYCLDHPELAEVSLCLELKSLAPLASALGVTAQGLAIPVNKA